MDEILKSDPELALALAMVLTTEQQEVFKAYLDVLPVTSLQGTGAYDAQPKFNARYKKLLTELKELAATGIANRKK